MSDGSPAALEVIYEPPPATRASWWAAVGAVVFVAGVAWLIARVMQRPWIALAALALVGALYAVQLVARHPKLLSPRRVVADTVARVVRVEHRRGVVTLDFDEIRDVSAGTTLLGDGLSLDSVTIARREGEAVTFSVLHKGAADGAERALKAVLGMKPEEKPAATA